MDEYQKLQWLLKRFREAEDFCRPYFDRAKRYYRLYRFGSAIDKDKWPYVNRVRTRDILAFVEDSTATMIQSLLGSYPFYSVLPRRRRQLEMMYQGIDTVKIAQQIEAVLNYQVSAEDTEFLEEQVDFFKEGMIFGTSYEGIYPRFEGNRYVGPLCKTIGYWDVLPIPGARRASKARGLFVREYLSVEEILSAASAFPNVEKFKEKLKGNVWNTDKWHTDLLAEVGITDWSPDQKDIEVLHYFSGGDIITIANRGVILRDSSEPAETGDTIKPFPYSHPVIQYKYMPLPQEWYGMGIPEVLEILQEDKNLIRSARRDNIDLVINKVLKCRAGADINYDLIKFYPSAIWPLENINDIEAFDIPDVTQSSYMEEEKVRFDMENTLSMFGYSRGMTPTHEERPTTVIKLQQASMNRLDLAVKLAEFTTLQQIAQRVVLLTRAYMPQAEYENIIGDQDAGFYRLPIEEIRLFYHIKPMGSSVTHVKEIRQQQLVAVNQMLQNLYPVSTMNIQPFTIDWLEVARAFLESMDIKNVDQLLLPIANMPQMPMPGQEGIAQQPADINGLMQVPYGGGNAA